MIKAKYTVEGNKHTLSVCGHANYSSYGTDIVCAGASALVQALIGWIDNADCKVVCISQNERNNEYIVSCIGREDVEAVFYMTYIGLAQIAEAYPNHVQINLSE